MKRRTQVAITAGVIGGGFALLTFLERRRPLRRQSEDAATRVTRNLALGAMSLAAARAIPIPKHARGVLGRLRLPKLAHAIASIVLLDYSLWWWHRWNHQWAPLWRFHVVHHLDGDMDASTAFRFHFGEHFLSAFYRAAQVAAIGATPFEVWVWQLLLFASILFHHSNVRLPIESESRLVRWIVTPRLHGIHHASVDAYTNSNFSSLLTCWDVLHRTFLFDVPDREVRIGVEGERSDPSLREAMAMPFQ